MKRLGSMVLFVLSLSAVEFCLAGPSWASLSPNQKQALAPLSQQWGTIPDKEQQQLLETAESFSILTPDQKQRFHQRLSVWINLSPAQRDAAREKYRAFSSVPSEMQAEVKQMLKENTQK